MREREPTIQTMKLSDARQQFSQVVNRVFRRESRVVVEKSGIPVVAIVSAEDLKELERLDVRRDEDFKVLDATRAAFRDVPDEELEQQVIRAVRAARQQLRRQRQGTSQVR